MTSAKRDIDKISVDSLNLSFVPKKKVPYHYGKTTLLLYPDVTNDMMDAERTLAFNVNKLALSNQPALESSTMLSIMGEKHNCTNTVDVQLAQWYAEGFKGLLLPDDVSMHSYHDHTGAQIDNCLDGYHLKDFNRRISQLH